MKKSISLLLTLIFILLLPNCEELADCTELLATQTETLAAYSVNPTDSTLCKANLTAYQEAFDAGCDSTFTAEGAANLQVACDVIHVVTEADKLAAQALVDEANSALFRDLGDMLDEGEDIDEDEIIATPGTTLEDIVDLDNSYSKYEAALALDPENRGANFGVGFMVVATASEDDELETTLNQWAECLDSLGMVGGDEDDDEGMQRSMINNNAYKMGIPQSGRAFFSFDALRILDYLPIITSHKNILGRSDDVCPEIESIQNLLENVFLSRLTTAINSLDRVVGTDFVFEITNEMWKDFLDDDEQEPIDIDDTEIYLMKSLLHQIRAMIYAVITYNVNVPYYDLLDRPDVDFDWETWLKQDSEFLTIRPGQENSWGNAHADLNNVLNSIESAWTFLQQDTDTDYDIIILDEVTDMEEDMEEEMENDIDEFLDEARQVLNEEYTVTLDFEDCEEILDESGNYQGEECESDEIELILDIKNFLTNPPQNLKAIIPPYNLQNGTCEDGDHDYYSGNHQINVTLDVTPSLLNFPDTSNVNGRNYDINCSCRFNYDTDSIYVDLHHFDVEGNSPKDSLKAVLKSKIAAECSKVISGHANESIDHFSSINLYPSGTISNNQIVIDEDIHYGYETFETTTVGCPKLSWVATDCDSWKNGWDVTLGGLFPQMTTTKLFDDILPPMEEGETFTDVNNNGTWDEGEPFEDTDGDGHWDRGDCDEILNMGD